MLYLFWFGLYELDDFIQRRDDNSCECIQCDKLIIIVIDCK